MRRSFDTAELNYFVNPPMILPNITNDSVSGKFDCGAILDREENIMFVDGFTALIFLHQNDNIYSMDLFSISPKSGLAVRKTAIKALDIMFTSHGAHHINAEIAGFNRAAQHCAYALGFRRTGSGTRAVSGKDVPVIHYGMGKPAWDQLSAH